MYTIYYTWNVFTVSVICHDDDDDDDDDVCHLLAATLTDCFYTFDYCLSVGHALVCLI